MSERKSKIMAMFKEGDTSGDGTLSKPEFKKLMEDIFGSTEMEDVIQGMWTQLNENEDDRLTFDEFYGMYDEEVVKSPDLEQTFKEMDTDGSGFVEASEFHAFFEKMGQFEKQYTTDLMAQMDKNKDGKINLQEFKDAYYA